METRFVVSRPALEAALNRTIVGWKQTRLCYGVGHAHTFKSHHSGMETNAGGTGGYPQSAFKSHHSGMETINRYPHGFKGVML